MAESTRMGNLAIRSTGAAYGIAIVASGIVATRLTDRFWIYVLTVLIVAVAGSPLIHLANARWNPDYRPPFPFPKRKR